MNKVAQDLVNRPQFLDRQVDRSVVGRGAQGCVIKPAIVFEDSEEITKSNATQQVSKLLVNPWEEWDTTNAIQERLRASGLNPQDLGIFPVDRLHCGVQLGDLGPNAPEILRKCQNVSEQQMFLYLLARPSQRQSKTQKDFTGKLVAGETPGKRVASLKYDIANVCAIQQPVQETDFYGFSKENFATRRFTIDGILDIASNLQNTLKIKLNAFHNAQIVHLDIKSGNLALKEVILTLEPSGALGIDASQALFADFGFSSFLDTAEEIEAAWKFVTQPNFFAYYMQIGVPAFSNEEVSIQFAWNNWRSLEFRDASTKREALKMLDDICLMGACQSLVGPEYFLFSDHVEVLNSRLDDLLQGDLL